MTSRHDCFIPLPQLQCVCKHLAVQYFKYLTGISAAGTYGYKQSAFMSDGEANIPTTK